MGTFLLEIQISISTKVTWNWSVMYFDQQTGASHAIPWSKLYFLAF